jgi:hypothetical protein
MIDDGDCREIGGMKIGRGNRSTLRKPAPAPLFHHKSHITIFYYLVCEAIGTAATPGLLCQLRMIVKKIVEKEMECRLAGETEVLGENLSITKSRMTRLESEPGPPRWEAGD